MIPQIKHTQIILYVKNQQESTQFYQKIFRKAPDMNVSGMTEFILNDFCKLGLMPNDGIAKIITPILPHPNIGNGIPRCELYFTVNNLLEEFQNVQNTIGVTMISNIEPRDWGDTVFYFADLDGHVIAMAERIN